MSAGIISLADRRDVELAAHPIADKYSLLTGTEFEEFKADIKRQGVLEPIWLYEGKILDGRNRYRACRELGIEAPTRQYTGDSPASFSWAHNGLRLHEKYTASQRACFGLEQLPEVEAEARKNQMAAGDYGAKGGRGNVKTLGVQSRQGLASAPRAPKSVEVVAKRVGCGASEIEKAKRIKLHRPDLFKKVEAGEMSCSTARNIIQLEAAQPPKWGTAVSETAPKIRALAAQGQTADVISTALGLSITRVNNIAREQGITLPSLRKKHDTARRSAALYLRAVEQTVLAMEGYAFGLRAVAIDLTSISSKMAAEWVTSLNDSMQPINALRKSLKGIAHAKG